MVSRSVLAGFTALLFSFSFLMFQVLYSANAGSYHISPVIMILVTPMISVLYMYVADQLLKQFHDGMAYLRIYLVNLLVWVAFYNLGYLVVYSLGISFILHFLMIKPYGHTRHLLIANTMAFVFFLVLMTILQAFAPFRLCDCDFERIKSCYTEDMSTQAIYNNLFCNDISAPELFCMLLVAYSGFVHAFFGLTGIRLKNNAS